MSTMITVEEVAKLCNVGNGKAYQIIREVNKEMKEKGYLIIRGRVNKLTAIFNYAIKFRSLQENPCHKAESIGKKHAEEMNIWTYEEFQKFSEATKEHIVAYTGFNILFWCGLRIGELLTLEIRDIDFEKKTLNINKSY